MNPGMPTRSGKCSRVCQSSCSTICSGMTSNQSSNAALPSRASAIFALSTLDHLDDCPHGHDVSIGSKAGDDCRRDFRDVGVVVVLFALVNVGNMKFHDRSGEHLQGIEYRD